MEFDPDLVLVTSNEVPKLTKYPTYGILSGGYRNVMRNPRLIRNVLSYDAYLTLSPILKRWAADLAFGARKLACPIGRFGWSAPATTFHVVRLDRPALSAVVSRLATGKCASIYQKLSRSRLVRLYGPCGAFSGIDPQAYFGDLETDGLDPESVFRSAGVGLFLNYDSNSGEEIARELLEIVASGAICIAIVDKSVQERFGDNILYVDPSASVNESVRQIQDHMHWIWTHPETATRMAYDAHQTFSEQLAYEVLVPNLMELHDVVLRRKGYVAPTSTNGGSQPDKEPSVSYIIRTGTRPHWMLRRALQSLVDQHYSELTVIFVLHAEVPELEDFIREFPTLKIKVVKNIGCHRSTAIRDGMAAVESDYFGLLDDDDELFPNHVRSLIRTIAHHDRLDWRGKVRVAYSGSIESGAGPRPEREQWRGSDWIDRGEFRCVEHFQIFRSNILSRHVSFMMSNSWLAHRSLIDEETLEDPEIDTCEDLYFELQFAQKSFWAFSCELTAVHHFHAVAQSTFKDQSKHVADTERVALRLWGRPFPMDRQFYSSYSMLNASIRETALFNGQDLLPLMRTAMSEVTAEGELHVPLLAERGIAVFGPYLGLEAGSYNVTFYLEVEEVDYDADRLFEIDVVCQSGTTTVCPPKAITQDDFHFQGNIARIDVFFAVPPPLTGQSFEFRIIHLRACGLRIFAVTCAPSPEPERSSTRISRIGGDLPQLPPGRRLGLSRPS